MGLEQLSPVLGAGLGLGEGPMAAGNGFLRWWVGELKVMRMVVRMRYGGGKHELENATRMQLSKIRIRVLANGT
ncbi:hypothetical protein V6N13_071841 [Hibiscus sabdariffa]